MPTTLILTLKTFSATGGIEKMCRIIGKALNEHTTDPGSNFLLYSMYDEPDAAVANPYFSAACFCGFANNKWKFATAAINKGRTVNTVLLSHVNLLSIGWLIKKLAPSTKLILLTHGIEIWQPLSGLKKKMLSSCDQLIAVSAFTKQKIISAQGIGAEKITVLNNCIDPELQAPTQQKKQPVLLQRFGCNSDDKILLTLTRVAATERHKGYEKVMLAMAALKEKSYGNLKYIIAGKYTESEKTYILDQAIQLQLSGQVILAGFIPEEEMADFFGIADMYVMPSKKEGFGLIFVEAMYHGLPVIAGNVDGSVDALANGSLGLLVNPDEQTDITNAIQKMIDDTSAYIPDSKLVIDLFSFQTYQNNLLQIL